MQDTPDGLIEELKFRAIAVSAERDISPEETIEWEAAEMLQEFLDALRAVARGEVGPEYVTRLLDPVLRLMREVEG